MCKEVRRFLAFFLSLFGSCSLGFHAVWCKDGRESGAEIAGIEQSLSGPVWASLEKAEPPAWFPPNRGPFARFLKHFNVTESSQKGRRRLGQLGCQRSRARVSAASYEVPSGVAAPCGTARCPGEKGGTGAELDLSPLGRPNWVLPWFP